MRFTISLSEEAFETFDAIQSQLYQKWGSKVAEDFEERVFKVLNLITAVSVKMFQSEKGIFTKTARYFIKLERWKFLFCSFGTTGKILSSKTAYLIQ